MPASSKRQFRFMKAVEGGYVKAPGLSKQEAKEYTSENKSYKSLPEKAPKERFKKLKEKLKGK